MELSLNRYWWKDAASALPTAILPHRLSSSSIHSAVFWSEVCTTGTLLRTVAQNLRSFTLNLYSPIDYRRILPPSSLSGIVAGISADGLSKLETLATRSAWRTSGMTTVSGSRSSQRSSPPRVRPCEPCGSPSRRTTAPPHFSLTQPWTGRSWTRACVRMLGCKRWKSSSAVFRRTRLTRLAPIRSRSSRRDFERPLREESSMSQSKCRYLFGSQYMMDW
ncbi:hypothetical protein C8Q80DRAFT_226117 [Daedaleopsis nitida]|nr:hypothetical protein C8Q80DRAFT_226117 [Daedaleopsis nitida]